MGLVLATIIVLAYYYICCHIKFHHNLYTSSTMNVKFLNRKIIIFGKKSLEITSMKVEV